MRVAVEEARNSDAISLALIRDYENADDYEELA